MSHEGSKLGIVVEGGGLRGAFAAGALAELDRLLDVRPQHVFATSSGAPNAAYFTTGQIAEGVAIWEHHTHGSQLIDFRNLVRARPVMKIDDLIRVFRDQIRLRPEGLDGSAALHVAVTDVESGRHEIVRATSANIFALLRAAMAIPIAYGKVVEVERGQYVDGGFGAPVAIREALAMGLDKIVVVLTKPKGHRRRENALGGWLQGRSYPGHPRLRQTIRDKWRHYNATMDLLDQCERDRRVVIVRPHADLPATRLSRSRSRVLASVELGRQAILAQTKLLRAYLAGHDSRR